MLTQLHGHCKEIDLCYALWLTEFLLNPLIRNIIVYNKKGSNDTGRQQDVDLDANITEYELDRGHAATNLSGSRH
jgi:hypothetical protein